MSVAWMKVAFVFYMKRMNIELCELRSILSVRGLNNAGHGIFSTFLYKGKSFGL